MFNEKLLQCEDKDVYGIRKLCPTRWTVRTGAIDVIKSYATILDTLEEIHQTTHDEYGVKAAGLLAKFETFFGLKSLTFWCSGRGVNSFTNQRFIYSGSCIISKCD